MFLAYITKEYKGSDADEEASRHLLVVRLIISRMSSRFLGVAASLYLKILSPWCSRGTVTAGTVGVAVQRAVILDLMDDFSSA